MKYRHDYHAGNFADVHKHVALLDVLSAMQHKDKGLLYLETHAGAGWYERDAGAVHSVPALPLVPEWPLALQRYLQTLAAVRAGFGSTQGIAGSPVLAAHSLRAQDRAVCCESQTSECRALVRHLKPFAHSRALCADGWQQLAALLPPVERRALILIDPPYEETAADFTRGLAALTTALQRLPSAVILLWYPIKDERSLAPWLQRIAASVTAPVLSAELWLHPRDSRVALNGSGLLVVNPPWQWEQSLAQWQPVLLPALGASAQGGCAQRWIVHEPD